MKQIKIIFLAIIGKQNSCARVDFVNDLNIIYGASNTGKSFILKAIDFMLGAEKLKKKIPELKGYERFFLGITLEGKGNFTLERSIKAGDYNVYNGFIDPLNIKEAPELRLKASHKDNPSLSNFILEYLGWNNKKNSQKSIW